MIDLVYLIENINSSRREKNKDLNLVMECIYKYPYFQIGHIILAKISHPISLNAIQKAAIYATDRSYLKALLNNTFPFNCCKVDDQFIKSTVVEGSAIDILLENREDSEYEDVAMVHFINGYIDDIYKKAPKEIIKQKSRLQYATIAKFLKANIKFQASEIDSKDSSSIEDLTIDSLTFSDEVATEKLAEILLAQGKIESALDIYEKIVSKYPHRKDDVGPIIKNLNSKKNV